VRLPYAVRNPIRLSTPVASFCHNEYDTASAPLSAIEGERASEPPRICSPPDCAAVPHDLDADTWMEQAERDLRAAEHLLRGDFPEHATVVAHLAVEKALKGVFKRQKDETPPVTHDLRHLACRLDFTWNRDRQDALDGLSDISILALYAPDQPFGHPGSPREPAARERVADARTLVPWLLRQANAPDAPSTRD